MDGNVVEIREKLDSKTRKDFILRVDAEYGPQPGCKNLQGDIFPKLFPVGTGGGFRVNGSHLAPKLIVLYTTGEVAYWQDEVDKQTGIFLYYGDNRTSGKDLHKTKLGGNEILKNIFTWASMYDTQLRRLIPPIFIFEKTKGWNRKFLGLAVPGIKGRPEKEWLTAVWGCDEKGNRFQNYRALFTIVDTGMTKDGCAPDGINLGWIDDIINGNAVNSKYAPYAWKKYIENKDAFRPLISTIGKITKDKNDQLPQDKEGKAMLKTIHDYFYDIDGGYSFEEFAIDVAQGIDQNVFSIIPTQPYKDGGFDGIGTYTIFKGTSNQINVEFYLEAKCYSETDGVGTKQTSRLISRIKNRQFGILVTTSYIAPQAYEEIVSDGHPVAFITGKTIIDYLRNQMNIMTVKSLKDYLNARYKK